MWISGFCLIISKTPNLVKQTRESYKGITAINRETFHLQCSPPDSKSKKLPILRRKHLSWRSSFMCLTASELIWSRAPVSHCFQEQGNPCCSESNLTGISKTDTNTRRKALSVQVCFLAFSFSQTQVHTLRPLSPKNTTNNQMLICFSSLFPLLVLLFTQIYHWIRNQFKARCCLAFL